MRKKSLSIALSIILCLVLVFQPYQVFAATVTATLLNRTELHETNLNGAVIRMTLVGDSFRTDVKVGNFTLNNVNSECTISTVTYVDSKTVDITLAFTGKDFDSDYPSFYIKALKSGLISGASDIISNNMLVKSGIERIVPSFNPSPLSEVNLNGNVMTLNLENDKYITNITASHFTITVPTGVGAIGISKVERVSDTQVKLTLSYDGLDFDANKSGFKIRLLKSGIVRTDSDLNTEDSTILAVQEKISVTTINPSPLMETDLNGTIITVNLSGDTFIPNISQLNFQLVNPVSGLSISRVDRISDTKVNIILGFNGADFDADKTNFAIKLQKSGLTRTATDLQTSNMTIYAVVEGYPSIRLTTNPTQLYELSVNGCYVILTLREDDFKNVIIPSYFHLNNAPPNTIIYKATLVDAHKVYLELSFDGTDFDTDITNFSVTTLPAALVGGKSITSNNITIIANKEIEGQGDYIVTGESYPTDIQMTGYNSRDNKMYINIDLQTNKAVLTEQTAVYEYLAWIYDNNGDVIGKAGSIEAPLSISGTTTAKVKNLEISLTSPLTSQYRIVVSVIQVSIN